MSSKSKTVVEKYHLPATIDGICALVRETLKGGLVQKIDIEIGKPVRVVRRVDDDGVGEDDITWDAALRNVEKMIEVNDKSSAVTLVKMLSMVSAERVHPSGWVTGSQENNLLGKWVAQESGVPAQYSPTSASLPLFGYPVHEVKSLPEDTLILCAAPMPSSEPEEVTFAVKTAMALED